MLFRSDQVSRAWKRFAYSVAVAAGALAFAGVLVSIAEAVPTDLFIGDGRGGTVEATPDGLIAAARERGRIPVIVRLRGEFVPEGNLSLFGAANQRAAIEGAQRRVLGGLSAPENVKRFTSVPVLATTVDAAGLSRLMNDPEVEAVYEDIPVPPTLSQSVPFIRANKAGAIRKVRDGKGWAVAVLDTGVQRDHKSLKRKIVAEACYSTTLAIDNATSVCPGGAQSSTAPKSGANCNLSIDGCDHGTHVAGIAVGDPKRSKLKGVARKSSLIPIQVFSRFTGTICDGSSPCALSYTSDQLAALERVNALASSHKIAAVNMSLGGGLHAKACDKNPLKPIIDTLRSKRIAVVIAAGNDSKDGRVSSPGCISSAVTVASTTLSDTVSSFSNFGSLVDLAAPGSSITSSVPKNKFATVSGTSMATPHVAGTWALLRRAFPKASVNKIEKRLRCSGTWASRGGAKVRRIDAFGGYKALKNGC